MVARNAKSSKILKLRHGHWLLKPENLDREVRPQYCNIEIRGATEQLTLTERGKFHENSIPILRVDYSCVYKYITTY